MMSPAAFSEVSVPPEPIAVVGLALRFAEAATADEFWRNLADGVESLRRCTIQEQIAVGVPEDLARDPQFVPLISALDDAEGFDHALFGFTRREAELRDPQHRLFLEAAHTALEHAGIDPRRHAGAIGVYAGVKADDYLLHNLRPHARLWSTVGPMALGIANDHDFVATLTSWALDLRGPSMTVNSACSTSLVAVHLACTALRLGECDLAIAGGASLEVPLGRGYLHQEGDVLSPDGRCRPFDADARGTLWGSGVAAVVLKPLSAALADRDTVHAVLLGSAVNNDGAAKSGFAAPSADGQAAVISRALAVAGVDPRTVGYVEAHGTGTVLGDPIEVEALSRAYGRDTSDLQWCALGSVKSNLGHLVVVAGMAGLIKAVLALEHRQIPPTLHVRRPNPRIDFASTPFRLATALEPWAGDGPRRAGVSAFGIGGTNAHVLLEEAPPRTVAPSAAPRHLLPLSAATADALRGRLADLGRHLAERPDADPGDVAYTLQVGRSELPFRACLVASGTADAADALGDPDSGRVRQGRAAGAAVPVAFMFPGQGAQHPGMARGLYETFGVYRREFDRCAEILRPHLGQDLRDVVFRGTAAELAGTDLAQPALFAVEWSLAQLLGSWGIAPAATIGHSIGEYVAATLAGVFALPGALALVAARGRLVRALPSGAMAAVPVTEAQLRAMLLPELSVAAVNAPRMCVVAGPDDAVDRFTAALAKRRISARRLHTSHAFHSAMMDPALDAFAELVAATPRSAPRLPVMSGVTGAPLSAHDAVDPQYWARHLRDTVRFADCLASLVADGRPRALVEVGPGRALTELARAGAGGSLPLPLLPGPGGAGVAADVQTALEGLGELWLHGVTVDWSGVSEPERSRVPLPTYPYQRRRCWIDPPERPEASGTVEKRRSPADWYEVPGWRQAPPTVGRSQPGRCLLLCDRSSGLAGLLAAELRRQGAELTVARPADRDGYAALLGELDAAGQAPDQIVVGWDMLPPPAPRSVLTLAEAAAGQERAFGRLLELAAALVGRPAPVRVAVITANAQDVDGDDLLRPELALVAGVVRTLPLEAPHVSCRHLDIDLRSGVPEAALAALVTEMRAAADAPPVVALRRGKRWLPTFESLGIGDGSSGEAGWRERGVYLITGGLGGIGLSVAEHLARRVRARLVLAGRSGLPARADWDGLAEQAPQARAARAVRAIRRMEAAGAEVEVMAVDVTEPAAVAQLRDFVLRRFGALHGVIHAAGVPGGGMIELKDPAAAAAVLAPKLAGTIALAQAVADLDLDAFVLCSSVTGVAGGFGQADYGAANAFLDAYARSPRRAASPMLSVNWGAWLEVGMYAEAAGRAGMPGTGGAGTAGGGTPSGHPWLPERRDDPDGTVVLSGRLAPGRHWFLGEHRLGGVPVVPGTAYVEIIRAAVAARAGGTDGVVELREVMFLAPLAVADGAEVLVEVAATPGDDGDRVEVRSVQPGGSRQVHACAVGQLLAAQPFPAIDVQAIKARCAPVPVPPGRAPDLGPLVQAGPHWQALGQVCLGDGEELAALAGRVDPHVVVDPALLDAATAFGAHGDDGQYLPFGYRTVRIRARIPDRCYSLLRHRPGGPDLRQADVTVTDTAGREVVSILGFMLRRVRAEALAAEAAAVSAASDPEPGGDVGIRPADGVVALWRLLAAGLTGQVVVSAVSMAEVVRGVRSATRDALARSAPRRAATAVKAPDAVAAGGARPGSELESALAALWSDVLGEPDIPVDADFFALGGNSLVAVQLVWRVGDEIGDKLSMRDLLDAPTVAGMARAIERLRAAPPPELSRIVVLPRS
jgi:phthiocerol/phenolphthiocerol synthesis type-I polyketide synthase E